MKRTGLPAAFVLAAALLMTMPAPAAHATDDGTWSVLETNGSGPSARREYAAVYDVQRDRYIIFGGWGFTAPHPSGLYLETWALTLGDLPSWSPLLTEGSGPGERHSPQWGYDPARERLIIFGGYGHHYPDGPNAYLNDVWELSLGETPTWTEITPDTPSVFPSGRLAGASIYDPLRQRFVVFGGTVGATVDTYVLDLSVDPPVWSILPTNGSPPFAGYGMTAIYDPVRDRLLMFGGSTSDDYWGVHDDVWELALSGTPTWTELVPKGPGPIARRTLTSIYDAPRDRMVIFGGWDNFSNATSSFLDDVWALSLSGDPVWTELQPDGPLPIGRDAMTAAYDAYSDRMVVFGGWSGAEMLNDTRFLDWGTAPEAVVFTPSAQATPDVAQLRWGVTDALGTNAAVFRRVEGGEWSSVAMVQRNGVGEVVYDDPNVTPGATYEYLVAVPSQRGSEFGGEISVEVPTTIPVEPGPVVSFALRPIQPNPVVDRLTASFVLPTTARAELALYDVAGRRMLVRDVGGVAGPRQVELGHARDLAPGLYFLKLEQEGQAQTRRVIIAGL